MTNFEWVNITCVDKAVLQLFDCGEDTFNEFLTDKAIAWQLSGEATTYVFVLDDDKKKFEENPENNKISRIFGYAAINATGLLYDDDDSEKESVKYLSCAEIRMFAVDKRLHKHGDPTKEYSKWIFTTLLQNLYEMSTSVIGFRAIYLNSNKTGYHLYKSSGFEEIENFRAATEEDKIDIDQCTPLLLPLNDETMYMIFS